MLSQQSLGIDIFCRVIDNYGDAGVCWRLAAELARRGNEVRLWIDQPQLLNWLAAQKEVAAVQIRHWQDNMAAIEVSDVVIEAFGCDIDSFILPRSLAQNQPIYKVWLNLEYLTAQAYGEHSHLLCSPCFSGPLAGKEKYFFYPGFSEQTGGLLREKGLISRRNSFVGRGWLAQYCSVAASEKVISLFSYEPVNLAALLTAWVQQGEKIWLLLAAGRSQEYFQTQYDLLQQRFSSAQLACLQIVKLPFLTQLEFDYLLWCSDWNFVRGEDSLVRAIWAGRPFVWQIYPQHDKVHWQKLEAFLAMYLAQADKALAEYIRQWFYFWNSEQVQPLPTLQPQLTRQWRCYARQKSDLLMQQTDLVTRLLVFIKRLRQIKANGEQTDIKKLMGQ